MGEHEVENLYLSAINDSRYSPFANGRGREASLSLIRKMWAGTYDPAKAAKAYEPMLRDLAKELKRHGDTFSATDIRRAADQLRADLQLKRESGELEGIFPGSLVATRKLNGVTARATLRKHGIQGEIIGTNGLAFPVSIPSSAKTPWAALDVIEKAHKRGKRAARTKASKTSKPKLARIGARIVGGHGEDRDEGTIVGVLPPDMVEVAWSHGDRTVQPAAALNLRMPVPTRKSTKTAAGLTIPEVTARTKALNDLEREVRRQNRAIRERGTSGTPAEAAKILELREIAHQAGSTRDVTRTRERQAALSENQKIDAERSTKAAAKAPTRKSTETRRKVALRRLSEATTPEERLELTKRAEDQLATRAEIHRALEKSGKATAKRTQDRIIGLKRDLQTLIDAGYQPEDYRIRDITKQLRAAGIEIPTTVKRRKKTPSDAPSRKGRSKPQPESGYAYKGSDEITGGNWRRVSDEEWEIVMVSPERASKIEHLGSRTIDGERVNVWRMHDPMVSGPQYYAQQKRG